MPLGLALGGATAGEMCERADSQEPRLVSPSTSSNLWSSNQER